MKAVVDNLTPFSLQRLKEARHSRELFFLQVEQAPVRKKRLTSTKKKTPTIARDKNVLKALEGLDPVAQEAMKKMLGIQ